jgi:hypothetical protein
MIYREDAKVAKKVTEMFTAKTPRHQENQKTNRVKNVVKPISEFVFFNGEEGFFRFLKPESWFLLYLAPWCLGGENGFAVRGDL